MRAEQDTVTRLAAQVRETRDTLNSVAANRAKFSAIALLPGQTMVAGSTVFNNALIQAGAILVPILLVPDAAALGALTITTAAGSATFTSANGADVTVWSLLVMGAPDSTP